MDCHLNMTTQHEHTAVWVGDMYSVYGELLYALWDTIKFPNQLRKLGKSVSYSHIPPHFQCKWKPNFPAYHTTLLRSMYPLFLLGSKSHSALYPQLSCHYDAPLWFFPPKKRDLILAELLVNAVPTDCFRTSDSVLNRNLITQDKPFLTFSATFLSLKSKKIVLSSAELCVSLEE